MVNYPAPLGYLDGQWRPLAEISVSALDRGFLFADGIYEVIPVYQGMPFRLQAHLLRLERSMALIRLAAAPPRQQMAEIVAGLLAGNGLSDASVYLQVTRGAYGHRDLAFPQTPRPTIFGMCTPLPAIPAELTESGVSAVTRADIRWGACQVKSVALLANVLARQEALDAAAVEAILVRDGLVTEGCGSNVLAVIGGVLVTPPLDPHILAGITRGALLELARAEDMAVREMPLTVASLGGAEEIWLASSTREVLAVTRLDGKPVGDGRPRPRWRRIHARYQEIKRHGGLLAEARSQA